MNYELKLTQIYFRAVKKEIIQALSLFFMSKSKNFIM